MTQYNRLAVYGHRGWASSAIFEALAKSGAPLKLLYRESSDLSSVPSNVEKVIVDTDDVESVAAALVDVNILISLVGHEGVLRQIGLVEGLKRSKVKLFVPSDLAARYDEQGNTLPVNKNKLDVENAAKESGIPVTVVLTGNIAEFALSTIAMGVNLEDNKIVYTGNSQNEELNLCTLNYIAQAYAQIFSSTPIKDITNRAIGLCEISVTGQDITKALTKKYGSETTTIHKSVESLEELIDPKQPIALAAYCRKIWGTGQQKKMVGEDIWDVKGYEKATLQSLVVEGKLGNYRVMPSQVKEMISKLMG